MKHTHGEKLELWDGTIVTIKHPVPFWRAVHREGTYLGGNEGGSSYRVGDSLYVLAHDGTDDYHFVDEHHFAGRP